MTEPSFSDLLTVAEVAEELKVPQKQVYSLIHDEGLPVVNLSKRRYRVYRADLNSWLTARRAASRTDPTDS